MLYILFGQRITNHMSINLLIRQILSDLQVMLNNVVVFSSNPERKRQEKESYELNQKEIFRYKEI